MDNNDVNLLCMNCFRPLARQGDVCPACGYNEAGQELSPHLLRPRTILGGKYLLGNVLGQGGFGITYIGWDINLQLKVAIKEYYPTGFVSRETTATTTVQPFAGKQGEFFLKGKERFIGEARSLAKFFNLPGIVLVKDYFQENGTAYIVMAYIEGQTLKAYLKQNGGKVSVERALELLRPIVTALTEIHKSGLIHRDIGPDNIMMSYDGDVRLLDFGAAREFADSGSKSLSIMLKPGYAPEEQYRSKGVQGPWTDIYALCATIYKCITGTTPDESLDRMQQDTLVPPSELGVEISRQQEAALLKGLAIKQADRFQSVPELYRALFEAEGNLVPEKPEQELISEPDTRAETSSAPTAALSEIPIPARHDVFNVPSEELPEAEPRQRAETSEGPTEKQLETASSEHEETASELRSAPAAISDNPPDIPPENPSKKAASEPEGTTSEIRETPPMGGMLSKYKTPLIAGGIGLAVIIGALLIWSPWSSTRDTVEQSDTEQILDPAETLAPDTGEEETSEPTPQPVTLLNDDGIWVLREKNGYILEYKFDMYNTFYALEYDPDGISHHTGAYMYVIQGRYKYVEDGTLTFSPEIEYAYNYSGYEPIAPRGEYSCAYSALRETDGTTKLELAFEDDITVTLFGDEPCSEMWSLIYINEPGKHIPAPPFEDLTRIVTLNEPRVGYADFMEFLINTHDDNSTQIPNVNDYRYLIIELENFPLFPDELQLHFNHETTFYGYGLEQYRRTERATYFVDLSKLDVFESYLEWEYKNIGIWYGGRATSGLGKVDVYFAIPEPTFEQLTRAVTLNGPSYDMFEFANFTINTGYTDSTDIENVNDYVFFVVEFENRISTRRLELHIRGSGMSPDAFNPNPLIINMSPFRVGNESIYMVNLSKLDFYSHYLSWDWKAIGIWYDGYGGIENFGKIDAYFAVVSS